MTYTNAPWNGLWTWHGCASEAAVQHRKVRRLEKQEHPGPLRELQEAEARRDALRDLMAWDAETSE